MNTVLFYVSGHGYGHAVRAGEIIRALLRNEPETRILVRTQAPARMFPDNVEFSSAEFDPGVVEKVPGVIIDEEATRNGLLRFLEKWDRVQEAEIEFAYRERVTLIVADIPAMAGYVAAELGVPCIGISNFTWDWIYEPYAPEYLSKLEGGYHRMTVLLRLPFAQTTRLDAFREIIDVPLVARKSVTRKSTRQIGPPETFPTGRMRVLLGSRAEISPEALANAAAACPEFELTSVEPGIPFEERFAACDLVIAKLGFSMLAECIANRKPLLYPPRKSFREEGILQKNAGLHIPAMPIPLDDFYSGTWAPYLRELVTKTMPRLSIRTDGAEYCANFLSLAIRDSIHARQS